MTLTKHVVDDDRDTVPAPASGEEHAYIAWLCSSQERARQVLQGAPVTPELIELRREGLRRTLSEIDRGIRSGALNAHTVEETRRRVSHGLRLLEGA